MKLLHTSDLHLGIRLKEYSMIEDQKYILDQIVKIAVEEEVDGVMIAGDVYDKGVAPTEALGIYDDFLSELSDRSIPVFVISGNHDSQERVTHGRRSREKDGIHISPLYDGNIKPYVLKDKFGEVNIYMLPFIKPSTVSAVMSELGITNGSAGDDTDENGEEKKKKTRAMSYNEAVAWAVARMNIDPSKRNVLISHQYITNTERSGSEEDYLSVGGIDNVDASVYGDFDYVALGHVHGIQNIGPEKRIRYCGTPLKYSYREIKQEKSVTIVELGEKKSPDEKCEFSVKAVRLVPLHDMVEIKGSFRELTDESYYENEPLRGSFLHIVLTDEDDIPAARVRLRDIYPRIINVGREENAVNDAELSLPDAVCVEDKDPLEVISEFYKLRSGAEMTDEQRDYIVNILEEIKTGNGK